MATTTGVTLGDVKGAVSKYYGQTLTASDDLKTSACKTGSAPPAEVRELIARVPQEIRARYYGCGSPFPVGLKGSGLRVLDLGCGTGRDCYVCAALVGESGFVTGLDMTPEQLEVAQRHAAAWGAELGYAQPNMRFVQGSIEALRAAGIEPGSVDVTISNCVVNLSPDKRAVLAQAYEALAEGGEVFFSDVYCDRRLSAEARAHEVAVGECLGGALAVNDFVRLAREVGFSDPRAVDAAPIAVEDAELAALLAGTSFFSITFRLFKLAPGQLEAPPAEDYGQTVTYRGTLPGAPDAYVLDHAHTFETGKPVAVDGNTAAICAGSWLAKHFAVSGDRSTHRGQAAGAGGVDAAAMAALAAARGAGAGGCCPPKPAADAAPAGGASSGCCPPKPAADAAPAGGASSGCCPPKPAAEQAPRANGDCCPPKPAAEQAPRASGGSGCCPPKPAAATLAAAPAAPAPVAAEGKAGSGCCGGSSPTC